MTDSNKKSYLIPGTGVKVTPITSITAEGNIELEFTNPSGENCVFIVPMKGGQPQSL